MEKENNEVETRWRRRIMRWRRGGDEVEKENDEVETWWRRRNMRWRRGGEGEI